MGEKIEVHGDIGAAVNAESGSTVHIHHYHGKVISKEQELINHAVSKLMKICTDWHCKEEVEKISQTLYGITLFKNLQLDQIATLQRVAEVIQKRLAQELKKQEQQFACIQGLEEGLGQARRDSELQEQMTLDLVGSRRELSEKIETLKKQVAWQKKRADQPCSACEEIDEKIGYWKQLLICALTASFFIFAWYMGWVGPLLAWARV
ncbi:hypothetical protein [Iodobacter sp. BJB302]|uniref:hypothetical protein n=1 Tax=Iodobacter sp. BJB302 TaxID=1506510 RepID=UPI000C10718E|nr:hypothetical protein [Iodobacter sp. BJB302]PHV02808.1 hypothetical protein CSQ88_05190 [Iodobacter sp. BJB302]